MLVGCPECFVLVGCPECFVLTGCPESLSLLESFVFESVLLGLSRKFRGLSSHALWHAMRVEKIKTGLSMTSRDDGKKADPV